MIYPSSLAKTDWKPFSPLLYIVLLCYFCKQWRWTPHPQPRPHPSAIITIWVYLSPTSPARRNINISLERRTIYILIICHHSSSKRVEGGGVLSVVLDKTGPVPVRLANTNQSVISLSIFCWSKRSGGKSVTVRHSQSADWRLSRGINDQNNKQSPRITWRQGWDKAEATLRYIR